MGDELDDLAYLKVAAIVRLTAEFGRTQGVDHVTATYQAKKFWAEIEDLAAMMSTGVKEGRADG